MKENKFDIYVRNLVAGAEESVSPDVWKGVEAGLDRAARKRVVPVWLWRGAAVAAVAAAAAAFVLLRPVQNLSNQPTIQQPVAQATDVTLPAETQPEEGDVTPIQKQAARLQSRVAQVLEVPVAPETEEELPEEPVEVEIAPERKPDAVITPKENPNDSFASDDEALRQLAFEEHKTHRKGQLSMSVLGNIQSNTRPEGPASRVRRSPGMFTMPAPTTTGIYREGTEFSFGLPVSGGISFRYDFNPRWGIGTGVVYTNLSRSFLGDYHEVENGAFTKQLFDTDINNQQHYIGVPLNVFFNIVNTGNWNIHVRMDGMGEKLVDNHFLIHDSEGDIHLHQKAEGLQFSTGVGVGLEFKFSPNIGIYFDPTLRYYFDCNQPRSLRTIQPLRMDFEAGVRFSLGR
jgi:hypothetical protein